MPPTYIISGPPTSSSPAFPNGFAIDRPRRCDRLVDIRFREKARGWFGRVGERRKR